MTAAFTLLLLCACAVGLHARESRTVRTAQGPVRGYKNDEIFEFYSIPYATAPTGPKKFKPPLPGPVWTEPLEAVNDKIACPQVHAFPSLSMQENCLVANVFMPDTNATNLPVLVYVHGGGFQVGWGNRARPKTLVKSKKIVGVTFNYRLGAHGFLCLGTEDAPGNAGIKDQVALLRWVKKNIANFGGNPDDVTIAGSSAGGASVDLLMLSETTKDLYAKVIPESGTSLAGWSVQQDPIQNAKDFAKFLNFTDVDDLNKLEEFYKSATLADLSSKTFSEKKDTAFYFAPCLERKRDTGDEIFLDDTPLNIYKQGKFRKVPVLYGFDNMEGILKLNRFNRWKDEMNERFEDFLPADVKFNTEIERKEIAKTIKEFYFRDEPVSENWRGYIDYFSDMMIIYPQLKSVELQVAAGSDSVYLYEYSFPSPIPNRSQLPDFAGNIEGATHCAQSAAVYDVVTDSGKHDSDDYLKMRETLREMWLNFITTGKPVPEGSALPAWPAAGRHRSPYMDISRDIKLKGTPRDGRFHFWDAIYRKYHKAPIPPTQA